MAENAFVRHHTAKTGKDGGRRTENKRIDQPGFGRKFPEEQKGKDQKKSCKMDEKSLLFLAVQILFLFGGKLILRGLLLSEERLTHFDSAPSRSDENSA